MAKCAVPAPAQKSKFPVPTVITALPRLLLKNNLTSGARQGSFVNWEQGSWVEPVTSVRPATIAPWAPASIILRKRIRQIIHRAVKMRRRGVLKGRGWTILIQKVQYWSVL